MATSGHDTGDDLEHPLEGVNLARRSVLAALLLALVLAPGRAQTPPERTDRGGVPEIALPGAAWRLQLDLTDFSYVRERNHGSDNRTLLFLHRDGRTQLEVSLRPAIGSLGPADHRAARWKRLRALEPLEQDEVFLDHGEVAWLEYSVGAERHLLAFLQQERTRIEVHLTIPGYRGDQVALPERLRESLAIEDRRARPFRPFRGR